MSRSTHSDIGCLIRFIPARVRADSHRTDTNKPTENKTLSGEEAKAFYEEILQGESSSKQDGERKTRKRKHDRGRGNVKNLLSLDHKDIKIELGTDCQGSEQPVDSRHHQTLPSAKVQSHTDRNSGGNVRSRCQENESRMLFCAQNNDLQGLNKLLMSGVYVDIDYRDQYGWTALMCAAVARHAKIVKLLLSKGANKWLNNSKSKSALDLAREINAQDIVKILTYSVENIKRERNASPEHKHDAESFYCDICKSTFSDSSQKKHSSSTVHLFNLKLKPKPDPFMIPESNIGYRLMRSSGWDGEKGLGPEGKEGAKFPVKTVLKTDRLCLGSQESEKKKAKITHFGPNDTDAVKIEHKHTLNRIMTARASSKRERRRRELKEKRWETNLRQYMDMDCESIQFEKI